MGSSGTRCVGRRQMYKSFRVKNFRCFKDLQINDLGRVNLIAGKNNTGKTALLEAMYLHTRPKIPRELLNLQIIRGLDVPDDDMSALWRQFFYKMNVAESIEIEMHQILPDHHPLLCIFETKNTEGHKDKFLQYAKFLHGLGMSQIDAANAVSKLGILLHFSQTNGSSSTWGPSIPSDAKLPIWSISNGLTSSQFIPVQGRPNTAEIADEFSKLKLKEDQADLILSLQNIEPLLTNLQVLSPDGSRALWAEINGTQMPLRLCGEGTNRVCHIIWTMKVKDLSYLFIDEIENGIHHSVQKEVWHAISQAARESDVQVFATTHSLEMIRAAYEAFAEAGKLDELRFHRLYRSSKTDEIGAATYNELDLEAVATFDFDYEVRG